MAGSAARIRGAVLFDIDGTLVDSNYLHVVAWLQAFLAVGRPVDAASIHRGMGMGSGELLEFLLGQEDAARIGAAAKAGHSSRYAESFGLLRPFSGARELVRAVARRAKVVLATSASPNEVRALRAVLNVDDVVTAITAAADVDEAKPEPDIVQVALERAGVAPADAIFVGDTVWDVKASAAAGVRCVAVLTGGISHGELAEAGAAAIYPTAADLLDDLDEGPLASVLEPREIKHHA
jgi:HAD superfamily hydrolase (TIGR01509 family)